jgi:tetratricopeptide (TPR) repeat protein
MQALHRTIVVVDVAGYGDRQRTNEHRLAVRAGLYATFRRAFKQLDVPWQDCDHEDCGDGIFVLAPPEVPKVVFVEEFPRLLANLLGTHNKGRRPEEQIRLRMALHAGEVHYDDHGVAGASINLAFRILESPQLKTALAESAGVLAVIVSSWFFDEVVQHSSASRPANYQPTRVRVKETDTTAWICLPDQPDHAIARPDSTPGHPPTATKRKGMEQVLPRDTAVFTGRQDELALLTTSADRVDQQATVVIYAIDGMAGVGKTALAVHVAHLLADRFPDGQLFVRLHAHTPGQRPADPVDVLATLLSMTDAVSRGMTTDLDVLAGMWRDYLSGRKVLLILDDAAGHQQVEPLLPSSPGCLVLVTSRRRLTALDATVTLSLNTLPPHEASVLFMRMAGRKVVSEEVTQVADIVRLAGYLPLAIALVAGRLRHHPAWSVGDIAHDLSSTRGRLLEIRAEDIAVAAAFDLSYRDLPAEEQRFFCYLGMHPGPELDMWGATALAGVPVTEARAHLNALYDDHLLDESAPGRYRMPDLVRDYTQVRIRQDLPDDRGAAVGRLLAHYQRNARAAEDHIYGTPTAESDYLASAHTIVDVASALAWLRTERDNLVACVEYAASRGLRQQVVVLEDALTSFLWMAGPWEQAVLLRRSEQQRDDLLSEAHAFHRLGQERWSGNDFTGSIEAYRRALDIYQTLNLPNLPKRIANTLSLMGIAQLAIGELNNAIDSQEAALEIFRALDYPLGKAYVLSELGIAHRIAGNFDAAAQAHTVALETFRDVGGEFGGAFAFALVGLGAVRRSTGEIHEAVQLLQRALEIYHALGNQVGEADALNELGAAVGVTGDFAGAEAILTKALELYRKFEHRLGQAETHNNIGGLLRTSGNASRAMKEYRSALRLARVIGGLLEEARALDGMSHCEFELGKPKAAISHLCKAVAIYQKVGAAEAVVAARRIAMMEKS